MAEPKFHPFMRLPPELRHQIWEMSIGPREVVFGRLKETNDRYRKLPFCAAPPPPLLTACAESRAHMQRFYTKTYIRPLPGAPSHGGDNVPEYCWVNFAADTVRLTHRQVPHFSHLAAVRKLVVETFYELASRDRFRHPGLALEQLTILDLDESRGAIWWFPWIDFMEGLYYGCDAVAFDTTVLHGDAEPLTRENWLQVDRAWRKEMLDKIFWGHPELREQAERGGDDEDAEDVEHVEWPRLVTFRRRWRHVDGCACANKKGAPVNK